MQLGLREWTGLGWEGMEGDWVWIRLGLREGMECGIGVCFEGVGAG